MTGRQDKPEEIVSKLRQIGVTVQASGMNSSTARSTACCARLRYSSKSGTVLGTAKVQSQYRVVVGGSFSKLGKIDERRSSVDS